LIGGQPLTDLQKIDYLTAILEGGSYKKLRPYGNPDFYTKPLLDEISRLKREYIKPDDLATILAGQEEQLKQTEKIHQKGSHKGKIRGEYLKLSGSLEKNRELLDVYRSYEAVLAKEQKYDFEDMLGETISALEKEEEFLRLGQETYHYVLADEHQDVNGSQNRLLDLLVSFHERPNLFVVGDEKQAIYRFQGASMENFLYFEDRFPGTVTISLTDNYRSGQVILDAAHSLITTDAGEAEKLRLPLTATNDKNSSVSLAQFPHQHLELAWLTADISKEIKGGLKPEEIAVIARTNREVILIADALGEMKIATTASVDTELLNHPIIKLVRSLLASLSTPIAEADLITLLHAPYFKIPLADLVCITSAGTSKKNLLALIGSRSDLEAVGVTQPELVLAVLKLLQGAHYKSGYQDISTEVRELVQHSGLFDYALETNPLEHATLLRQFYDEVAELEATGGVKSLADLKRSFDRMVAHQITPSATPLLSCSGVSIMTAHKAKGLEFERVYITNATDRAWGGGRRGRQFSVPTKKNRLAETDIDDERRLFFVALTRAKTAVVLLASDLSVVGSPLTTSRFLDEIDSGYIKPLAVDDFITNFKPGDSLRVASQTKLIEPDLLKTFFLNRGLSVTALNNYRRSPWEYFYRNLLQVPEAKSLSLIYGNVMHAVMGMTVSYFEKQGALPTPTEYTAWLTKELDKAPTSTEDYTRLHERASEALLGYLGEYGDTLPKLSKQELSIKVMLQTDLPDLPEIPLKGVIDRVDIDEAGKYIRVVDYKTGKPKTKGQIEGTTKDSDGGYKRQLVFYKLLFSLLAGDKLSDDKVPTDYELIFLEPTPAGKYKNYSTTIDDKEVSDLTAEIIATAKAIVSGEFLDLPCDPEVCNYCDLANLLQAKK